MSNTSKVKRTTISAIRARKGGTPIVCIAAYSAPMARILDRHVDLILVGDSLGVALYGFESTLPVTLEMMIAHAGAVMRGSDRSCVIIDMPFATYQEGPEQAFRNCAQAMRETGVTGVKLEGGVEMAETISFLTKRGIPVMSHIGALPQLTKASPRETNSVAGGDRVIADAKAVADAGAFAMVVDGVTEAITCSVTEAVRVPTISIGTSNACDGQVMILDEVLGLSNGYKPQHGNRYADLGDIIEKASAAYAADVRAGLFPGEAPKGVLAGKQGVGKQGRSREKAKGGSKRQKQSISPL